MAPAGRGPVARRRALTVPGPEVAEQVQVETERVAFEIVIAGVLLGGCLVAVTAALMSWSALGPIRGAALLVGAAVAAAAGGFRIAVLARRLRATAVRRHMLERHLRRYVSPRVAHAIMSGAHDIADAELRDVTVLFCDLRDFTTLCERQRPEAVVELLNTFYERACDIVQSHGGTVNKFMGDGMLALFGAPNRHREPVHAAVRAAHDIMYAADDLRGQGGICAQLDVGISLDCGDVVVGEVGASSRAEYTAIGTAVNRAARLQGVSREASRRIVLSEAVAQRLGPRANLVSMGTVRLKGLSEPVAAYAFRHS